MEKNSVVQPEGNYYDKYHSSNFIVRWMMKEYFRALDSMLPHSDTEMKILEAGCGEGEVAGHIASVYGKSCAIDAFDISEKVILEAQEKYHSVRFMTGNIYEIAQGGYGLVVCCEVLEHLEHPEAALKQLAQATNKYIIISVPREPIWRCLNIIRGKYIKDFGNTPGHIQHWSSKGFIKFLVENGLKIEQIKKPLPWTMVLLKKG